MKKFPWLSSVLLLATYSTLGWLLFSFNDPISAWVVIVVGIFLLSFGLSSPWSKTRIDLANIFRSDTRAFVIVVAVAFSSVFVATWFHIFAHAFVVVSAGILFRLDAQRNGLRIGQIFWSLLLISFFGLGLGALVYNLIYPTRVEASEIVGETKNVLVSGVAKASH